MKHPKTLALLSTLAVFTATPSFGQERGEANQEGAERAMEAEHESPTFIRATLGEDAFVNDGAGHRLGSMIDHIIDRETGKLQFVAVQLKEEVGPPRLVPFDHFRLDAETKHLVLPVPRESLLAMPVFDAETLKATGELNARAASVEQQAGEAREAAMKKQLPRRLAGTTLMTTRVFAMNERFGTVSELLLDPEHGKVAFVLVHGTTTANDPYILPWTTLSWEVNDQMEGRFVLPIASHQLVNAPTLKEGNVKLLSEGELLHGIHAFFKHLEPKARTKPAEDTRG